MQLSPPLASPGDAAPPREVVVVGGGLAALRTVAELRERQFDGKITVISAEATAPYDRPPLSKQLLSHPEPLWLAKEGYGSLTDLADEVLFAHRATALDHSAGVRLAALGDNGTVEVQADAAVIATGTQPQLPGDWHGAMQLHDLDDAHRLRTALSAATSLIVIGAGWIGAEVATVAARHGLAVTVVEAGPAPAWHALGAEVGSLLIPDYLSLGIDLRCGHRVTDVAPQQVKVIDDSGHTEVLRAEVVLAATGVRPATAWLANALPLTARGALPVDSGGRILGGPAHVRAVGDCTDRHSPRDGVVAAAHWPTFSAKRYPSHRIRRHMCSRPSSATNWLSWGSAPQQLMT